MAKLSRFRERLDDAVERGQSENRRWLRLAANALRGVIDLGHQLVVDQCLGAASALAFTTILSLVPLLAVFFAIFRAFADSDAVGHSLTDFLATTFLAESVSQVVPVIEQFLERARSGTVGAIGFGFLMVTAVSLFLSIEQAINRIWRVPQARPFYRRITTFYAVVTLAPILMGLSFAVARWLKAGLEALPFGADFLATLVPWLLEGTALTLMYKLMPHTRVTWRAALIAAFVAAGAYELTKAGFNYYVVRIYAGSVNSKIYGSFALVPVFFLWVYIIWIIVLAGVEVSYFVQNRSLIREQLRARASGRDRDAVAVPTGYLVVRLFLEVAKGFRSGGGGTRLEQVATTLQISVDDLLPVLRLLKDHGFVLIVENAEQALEMVPARPLDRVTLAALYELTESGGYQTGQLPATDAAARVEERLRASRDAMRAALAQDVESFFHDASAAARPAKAK